MAYKLLDLVVCIFFLVILNELTLKCVKRFSRFVRIFEDKWNGKKRIIFLNVQHNKIVCKIEEFFFKDQYDYWVWLFGLVFPTLF